MEQMELNEVKMVLEDAKVEGGCITITKKDLEKWIGNYMKVGNDLKDNGCPTWQSWFYWGKREVLVDMLKQIENNE